jgi:peptidoglycan/LPS O-acetylase OafA/YrhL
VKHYPQFEVLRGISAMWVLLSHLLLVSGLNIPILSSGGQAVELFVILSGFVIALLCLTKQERYPVYIFRRFVRLYPLFLVALALGMATSHLYGPAIGENPFLQEDPQSFITRASNESRYFWQHLLAHLTMLHGAIPDTWLPQSVFTFSGPLWSISLEWQFYLIAPFLVAALNWYKQSLWQVLLLCSFIVLLRVATNRYWPDAGAPAFLPLRLELFALGIFCAIGWDRAKATDWKILLLWMIGLTILFVKIFHYGLFPIVVWLGVYITAALGNRYRLTKIANECLKIAPAQWIGQRSYGLYVLHMPIVLTVTYFVLLPLAPMTGQVGMFALSLLIILPLVLALAAICYRYIETPTIAWGREVGAAYERKNSGVTSHGQ